MTSRGDADPPATGTRTTRSKAPRTPQTPTATPLDLPDPPPETPKSPRGLVADIRAHLSHVQASKRKLSEAAYKDCFALLDALSSSLDDKDILSLSLDTFKALTALSPPIAKRSEFVIALDKKNELLTLPVPVIKEKVVAALSASGIPKLQEAELKGIKLPMTRKP
ncbi:hypothetical protein K438DRAFT_1786155 [Mycena galopus ATCC 62051]|nr:hypothetical protein K438DRAFT_1786155 [Mycena galopus ATCC 62051]